MARLVVDDTVREAMVALAPGEEVVGAAVGHTREVTLGHFESRRRVTTRIVRAASQLFELAEGTAPDPFDGAAKRWVVLTRSCLYVLRPSFVLGRPKRVALRIESDAARIVEDQLVRLASQPVFALTLDRGTDQPLLAIMLPRHEEALCERIRVLFTRQP